MSSRLKFRASCIAFSYRAFVLFQSSRVLSVTALEMLSVAVGWQVYDITHNPLDLGLIGLAQFLPGVLLFLPSGLPPTASTASGFWSPATAATHCVRPCF